MLQCLHLWWRNTMYGKHRKEKQGRKNVWDWERYRRDCKRGRERAQSGIWLLLVIHAVTHGVIHSLCSCAGHMRNTVSQHLPRPWKFILFHAAPSLPLPRVRVLRCFTDRKAGARLSQPSLPQTSLCIAKALVSYKGLTKSPVTVTCLLDSRQKHNSSGHSSDSAFLFSLLFLIFAPKWVFFPVELPVFLGFYPQCVQLWPRG